MGPYFLDMQYYFSFLFYSVTTTTSSSISLNGDQIIELVSIKGRVHFFNPSYECTVAFSD